MMKKVVMIGLVAGMTAMSFTSCKDQEFNSDKNDAKRLDVQVLNPTLAKVRDYVPLYAVIAHRGSTFWTPEETESAWRWAREMGVDYLESDLQATKDCIVLANHDENLARTTNIENVFSEYVPSTRKDFYRSFKKADGSQLFTEADIQEQYDLDVAGFRPYYALSYYYHELLMLDAGSWFNETSQEQARQGFKEYQQYVSALQDQIAYAEGKCLIRGTDHKRIPLSYKIKPEFEGMSLAEIRAAINAKGGQAPKYMAFVDYDFDSAYMADPQDTGNRPGIYIEFKESWLNPKNMEQLTYDVLNECDWNIITKPEAETNPFYVNGKVNVGNTNGKVILQTFSFDALRRANEIFQGRIPMCYLLWTSNPPYATDLALNTPTGYADFIKWAQDNGSHIIGPSIAGAPNNYPEMNAPWQAYMIRKSQMINHPYSFDSYAQMAKYMGMYNYGNETEFDNLMRIKVPATPYTVFTSTQDLPIYMDGFFTNRSEMSLRYMIEQGFRCNPGLVNPFNGKVYDNSQAPHEVPDAEALLVRLGYNK